MIDNPWDSGIGRMQGLGASRPREYIPVYESLSTAARIAIPKSTYSKMRSGLVEDIEGINTIKRIVWAILLAGGAYLAWNTWK